MKKTITYREATVHDAPFVALVIAEAVGNTLMEKKEAGTLSADDKRLLEQLEEVCRRTDTLYSWTRTEVALSPQGECVGALVSYPGEGYLATRNRTFALVNSLISFDVTQMDAETQDGEYYLDSLAIMPAWRGHGIARQLLKRALEKAHKQGRPAILACAPENTGAKHLYESLGFQEDGHMFIFGEDYLRMVSSSVTSS